jgi:hypothetical protein
MLSAAMVGILYSKHLYTDFLELLDENNAKKAFISYISHEIR